MNSDGNSDQSDPQVHAVVHSPFSLETWHDMNRVAEGKLRADQPARRTDNGMRHKPGWVTVFLLVAVLCIGALPRAIVLTGLSPVFLVVSAVIVIFLFFSKD
jgi:hypothetical protein